MKINSPPANLELYGQRMSNTFNKRIRLRSFQKGDLVVVFRSPMIISKKKRKLERSWEGLFILEKVFSKGIYLLITMEGDRIVLPIDACFLKKYYP